MRYAADRNVPTVKKRKRVRYKVKREAMKVREDQRR